MTALIRLLPLVLIGWLAGIAPLAGAQSGPETAGPPGMAPAAEPPLPSAAPQPRVVTVDIVPAKAAPSAAPLPTERTFPLKIERADRRPFVPQAAADVAPAGVLAVALNKARPLDLPGAARDVVIGNPAIADVVVRAQRQVFILGRALGDTNVFFLDAKGVLLRRVEIHVGPDAEGVQAAITRLLPDDDIQVTTVGDALFLTGKVRTVQSVNTAKTIARRFVAADANIINRMMLLGAQQVMLRVRWPK